MQPMKLQPLYDELVGATIVDPSTQPILPMAVCDAFETLSEVSSPTDDQKALLHECCLVLAAYNFRGCRPDAQTKLQELYSQNPSFDWRPTPTEDNDTV